jgi:hypothetical protein
MVEVAVLELTQPLLPVPVMSTVVLVDGDKVAEPFEYVYVDAPDGLTVTTLPLQML